jgi:adenylosuccinate synthase
MRDWQRVKPVFKTMKGWDGDLTCARHMTDLPPAVRDYLSFIEEYVGVPVAIVSVGPDREETVIARPHLVWGEGLRDEG